MNARKVTDCQETQRSALLGCWLAAHYEVHMVVLIVPNPRALGRKLNIGLQVRPPVGFVKVGLQFWRQYNSPDLATTLLRLLVQVIDMLSYRIKVDGEFLQPALAIKFQVIAPLIQNIGWQRHGFAVRREVNDALHASKQERENIRWLCLEIDGNSAIEHS